MADYREIASEKMADFCRRVFLSYGFTGEESGVITKVLLRADFSGIESHGVQRLIRYHNEIKAGLVDVRGKPLTVHETEISAVLDARKAMGQLVSCQAMELAIKKAAARGFGVVTVKNSNHYGIAGYYSNMAAGKDLVGICMTNSEAIGVPTFGREAMLGTNPIALAMPADPITFSYDAATTVVPRGKLEVYDKNNKKLPEQWALDAAGHPSTNAGEVLRNIINKAGGGIAPLGGEGDLYGGHKGYGFGIIVDLFTALFSGGLTSNYVNITPGLNGICHCFIAMDYGIFGDKARIRKNVSSFLQELRDSKKAQGRERIYTHGEKEAEMIALRENGSIPVNEKTFAEFREIAAAQDVAWNLD